MTKALCCRACNSVHTFKPDGSLTTCDCGRVEGWWIDADNGNCLVYAEQDDRGLLSVLSMHNGFLNDGPDLVPRSYYDSHTQRMLPFPPEQVDTFWRQLHTSATIAPKAPETVRVFDRSRRECWATLIEPGTAVDVLWATPEDAARKRSEV